MKKISLSFIALLANMFIPKQVWAQNTVEMADALRQSGKIYVVVTVVSIILIGLLLYLIRLDGKITKIEKEVNKK